MDLLSLLGTSVFLRLLEDATNEPRTEDIIQLPTPLDLDHGKRLAFGIRVDESLHYFQVFAENPWEASGRFYANADGRNRIVEHYDMFISVFVLHQCANLLFMFANVVFFQSRQEKKATGLNARQVRCATK